MLTKPKTMTIKYDIGVVTIICIFWDIVCSEEYNTKCCTV